MSLAPKAGLEESGAGCETKRGMRSRNICHAEGHRRSRRSRRSRRQQLRQSLPLARLPASKRKQTHSVRRPHALVHLIRELAHALGRSEGQAASQKKTSRARRPTVLAYRFVGGVALRFASAPAATAASATSSPTGPAGWATKSSTFTSSAHVGHARSRGG